jgi:hypothetical protein
VPEIAGLSYAGLEAESKKAKGEKRGQRLEVGGWRLVVETDAQRALHQSSLMKGALTNL